MMVNAYQPEPSRELARAVAAGALPPTATPSPRRARVLELGGWVTGNWRDKLSELVRQNAVAAVGLRTEAHERILSDSEWTAVVRQVADLAGLAGKGWVGVRVSPRTVTLLTSAADGPLPLHEVRAFGKRASVRALIAGRARRIDAATTAATGVPAASAAPPRGVAQLSFTAPPTPGLPDPAAATPPTSQATRPAADRSRSR